MFFWVRRHYVLNNAALLVYGEENHPSVSLRNQAVKTRRIFMFNVALTAFLCTSLLIFIYFYSAVPDDSMPE